jgi:hypothetical protein
MKKAFNTAWVFLKNYIPQAHLDEGKAQREEAIKNPYNHMRMVNRTLTPNVGQFRDERSDTPPTLPLQTGDYGPAGLKMPQEGMSEEEYNRLRRNPISYTPMYDPKTLDR